MNFLILKNNFKYWLLQIAKNNAYDFLRKYKRIINSYEIDSFADKSVDLVEQENDFHDILSRYNNVLKKEEYDIITLHLFQGFKFREIAIIYEKSTSSVNNIYSRGIQKIRKHMKEGEGQVKKVKEFLKEYREDVVPNINLIDLKQKIQFNDSDNKYDKKRFWDLKLLFSVILTMAFVIPLTYLATIVYMPANSEDPSRDLNQYLEINFETYNNTAIETTVITDNIMISFYLAEKDNELYLVAQIHSSENQLIKFYVDSKEVMDIDMNLIIINNFQALNHQFDLEISLIDDQEIIKTLVLCLYLKV